jgi:hypothetical protein
MRSIASVRIWLILTHERFGSLFGPSVELPPQAFFSERFLKLGIELCAFGRQAAALHPRELLGDG